MMHRAWSSIVEVPYCFSRSYVKFQGHTALKIVKFDPNWVVSGQQLQFEFTDGYEMLHKVWNSKGEVSYCFPRSSIKFQGHTGQNITDFDPNWAFPDYRLVAAFKSLRFALFLFKFYWFFLRVNLEISEHWFKFCACCWTWNKPRPEPMVDPSGPRLNIKDRLSRYGDSHVKDKTAGRTSYL